MWDLPGPGLEPVSPALAGGFPTTAPPGKPLQHVFLSVHPSTDIGCFHLLALVNNAGIGLES